MAIGAYVGVDSFAKRVSAIYAGVEDSARQVVAGYVGVNGVAQQFYTAETPIPDINLTQPFPRGRSSVRGARAGQYALFATGTYSPTQHYTQVIAYDINMQMVSAPDTSVAKTYVIPSSATDYAIFSGGRAYPTPGSSTTENSRTSDVYDKTLQKVSMPDLSIDLELINEGEGLVGKASNSERVVIWSNSSSMKNFADVFDCDTMQFIENIQVTSTGSAAGQMGCAFSDHFAFMTFQVVTPWDFTLQSYTRTTYPYPRKYPASGEINGHGMFVGGDKTSSGSTQNPSGWVLVISPTLTISNFNNFGPGRFASGSASCKEFLCVYGGRTVTGGTVTYFRAISYYDKMLQASAGSAGSTNMHSAGISGEDYVVFGGGQSGASLGTQVLVIDRDKNIYSVGS